MSVRAGARAGSADKDPTIRVPRTWQVGSRCLAQVKGQGRIGLENLERAGRDSCDVTGCENRDQRPV
jgi:hypothetical protein